MGKRKHIYFAVLMGISAFGYGCDYSMHGGYDDSCVTGVYHPIYEITNSIEDSRGLKLLGISKLGDEENSILLDKKYNMNERGKLGLYLKNRDNIFNKIMLGSQSITLSPELYAVGYWRKYEGMSGGAFAAYRKYSFGDYFPEFQFNFENTTQLGAKSYCTVTVKANTVTYQTYIDHQDTWDQHLTATNKYPRFRGELSYPTGNDNLPVQEYSSFTSNNDRRNLVYVFQGGGMSKAIEPIQRIYGDLDGFKAFGSDDDVSKAEVDIPISSCIGQKNETTLELVNRSRYTFSNINAQVHFNLVGNIESTQNGDFILDHPKYDYINTDLSSKVSKYLKGSKNIFISKDNKVVYFISKSYPTLSYLDGIREDGTTGSVFPIPVNQMYIDEVNNKTYFAGPYGIFVAYTASWGDLKYDDPVEIYHVEDGLASDSVNGIDALNNGQDMYAATNKGLSISHDKGKSWKTIFSGKNIKSVAAPAGGAIYMVVGKSVYHSTNSGDTWQSVQLGIESDNGIRYLFTKGDKVYLITSEGLFYTNNSKNDWHKLTTANGLPSNDIAGISEVNNTLYAFTEGGMFSVTDIFNPNLYRDFGDLLPYKSIDVVLKASTKLAYDKDYIISGITLSNGNQSYNNVTLKATADESGNHVYNCTITQNGKAIVNQYGTTAIRCVAGVSELGATISIF